MELVEFGPDDAVEVAAFVDVARQVDGADCPWEPELTPYRLSMSVRHSWDGEPGRWFVAYEAGDPVGVASIHTSEYDNLDMAWLQVRVAPRHRRRGHGTTILRRVEELAAGMGRTLFHVGDWDSDAIRGFATATGYEARSAEVRRMQLLRDAPDPAPIRDEALVPADEYELVRIEGFAPPELLPALAEITSAINDAPLDDLEYDDEVYTSDRVRAYEEAQIASGFRFRRILARHRATGELAGHTVVVVDEEQPTIAEQHDTSVARGHRGHRLGLLLKAGMLLWLAEAEPQLERLYTWNAESNAHMIAVNDRLGYQVMGRAPEFQRRLR